MMQLDHKYQVWHPYTQMKGAEIIPIVRGEGARLYSSNGDEFIDAISSWWTNIHGHAHPYIAEAIYKQASTLEQTIFAGFSHEPAIRLADKLLKHIPYHHKVFYTDNGSTAVEVALKMALQFWRNQEDKKTKIICFKDAYHGDTFGAMSMSGRGLFTHAFQSLLFDVIFIDTPTYSNEAAIIEQFNNRLQSAEKEEIAAFIFEPLVLGSAGMLMYSPQLLDKLLELCRQNGILSIADEVMTGFGRTGIFLATDYCQNKPDIVCLSKGITGGFLPFAATTCTQQIYDAFYSDEKTKMLFHGHSYTANPLGCAAGIASLELFERENTFEKIKHIEQRHSDFSKEIAKSPGAKNVQHLGTILRLELSTNENSGYLNNIRDKAYKFFIEHKIILRPLGNVVYILPPYCISDEELTEVYAAITEYVSEIS